MAALLGFDTTTGAYAFAVSYSDIDYLNDYARKNLHRKVFKLQRLPPHAEFYQLTADGNGYEPLPDYAERVQLLDDQRASEEEARRLEKEQADLNELLLNIDHAVGDVRNKYATDIAFQNEAYKAKEIDCRAFKAAQDPVVSDYPWLEGVMSSHNLSADAAADMIIMKADQWMGLLRSTEELRDKAKNMIRDASADARHSVAQTYIQQIEAL